MSDEKIISDELLSKLTSEKYHPLFTVFMSERVWKQSKINKPTLIKWTWKERVYFWLLFHWKWFAKRHQLKGTMIGERYK